MPSAWGNSDAGIGSRPIVPPIGLIPMIVKSVVPGSPLTYA